MNSAQIFTAFLLTLPLLGQIHGFALREAKAESVSGDMSFPGPEKDQQLDSQSCRVSVRAISGTGRSAEVSTKQLQTGNFISDVKSQLEPLPFSSYRVVDSAEKNIGVGKKDSIVVFDGRKAQHELSISPLWVTGDRVQVMVDWSGPSGENLLSTKVSIVKGKNVVVGTDDDETSSTIMCIKVDCHCRPGGGE